jgi:hypothetical protein
LLAGQYQAVHNYWSQRQSILTFKVQQVRQPLVDFGLERRSSFLS